MEVFVFLLLFIPLVCGLCFGICALSNWAVNYPRRRALNAQKARSAALTNVLAAVTFHFHYLDWPGDSGLPDACLRRMARSFNAAARETTS